tara:strand:- start:1469 stop:2389 length:921 start_codon:yes stop_codon:yes gene_type:complete
MSEYFDDKDLFVGPKVEQYGSHVVVTGVQRDTKTKYLNVDTLFRDDYNDKTTIDYNISFPDTLTNVKSITVTDMEVPITYYIISENLQNNIFKITNNITGISNLITLPDGDYKKSNNVDNGIDISTKMNDLLQAAGLNISFDISNNKSQFISNSIQSYTFEFAIDSTGNFNKNLFRSRLGYILGFRAPTVTLSSNSSVVSTAFINLMGPRYLFLAVQELNGQGNENSFVSYFPYSQMNKNILARITMDGIKYGFETMHIKDITSDTRKYNGPKDIKRINVKLLNEFGEIMDLNGHDISFCLRIEHL